MSLGDKSEEILAAIKSLKAKISEVKEATDSLHDTAKDNHDEVLKKVHENRAFMNILEKNQQTIWKKVKTLESEEEEEPEETE